MTKRNGGTRYREGLSDRFEGLLNSMEERLKELDSLDAFSKAGKPTTEMYERGTLLLSEHFAQSIREAADAYGDAARERNGEDCFRIARHILKITNIQGKNYNQYMVELHKEEAAELAVKIMSEGN